MKPLALSRYARVTRMVATETRDRTMTFVTKRTKDGCLSWEGAPNVWCLPSAVEVTSTTQSTTYSAQEDERTVWGIEMRRTYP